MVNIHMSLRVSCATALLVLAMPSLVPAQVTPPPVPPKRPAPAPATRLGLDVFGVGGVSWPDAKDSFNAAGLDSKAFEVGGGARVTGLWRNVFTQVAATRWSDTGERAFVASDGTVFPLGIPLDVEALYIDATVGIKDAVFKSRGRISYLYYLGVGGGVVRYKERSPFAEPGDDVDAREPSYHVLGGVEIPIAGWLAVALDGRYRHIPGLLGEGGTSAVLEQDSLGGFQTSVGLRLGFGGPRYVPPPPPKPRAPIQPPSKSATTAPPDSRPRGVITAAAPVFAFPDPTRVPLRTLEPGAPVFILEQKGDWVRVEFNDKQWGPRVGWLQRKFVRVQ